jgi:DNA-binding CsgD family transcriptional regulator
VSVFILFAVAACLIATARAAAGRLLAERSAWAAALCCLFLQTAAGAFLFAAALVNGTRIDLGHRVDTLSWLLPLRSLCAYAAAVALGVRPPRLPVLVAGAGAVAAASFIPAVAFGFLPFVFRAEAVLVAWSAVSAVAFAALAGGFGLAAWRVRHDRRALALTAAAGILALFDFLPFYGRQPLSGFPLSLAALACLAFVPIRPQVRRDGAPGQESPLAIRLSVRELEVARAAARGASNQEIADALFVSLSTVKKHLYNAMEKIDVRNRVELAAAVFAADQINRSSTVPERDAGASSTQGETSMVDSFNVLPGPFGRRAVRRAVFAGAALAAVALFAACAHGAVRRGLAAEPDGINVSPVPDSPGTYLVNPRFERVAEVSVVRNSVPDIDGPPPESRSLPASAWSYDRSRSRLTLRDPIDDASYWVMVRGRFAYPLAFIPERPVEPGSVRVIVDGAIGLEGIDYRLGAAQESIELFRTSGKTGWFALSYQTDQGQCSIGSMTPDRLTRAMAAHLGFPVDGNCRPAEGEGTAPLAGRFVWEQDPVTSDPWLVHLLPKGEGYVGAVLWPRDFTYERETRTLVLKTPIDPERYGVYALDEAQ